MNKMICEHNGIAVMFNQNQESSIDSRIVAEMLDIQHDNFIQTLEKHKDHLSDLGVFLFQTGKPKGAKGGRPEKYALLNEDQFIFAVTLSRNTPKVVQAKLAIVKAFASARKLLDAQQEYQMAYRALHQSASQLQQIAKARGSSAPVFAYHSNLEKLNNKLMGLEKGQRKQLSRKQKNVLSTLCELEHRAITETLANGGNDKQAYQVAKEQAQAFMQLYGNSLLTPLMCG